MKKKMIAPIVITVLIVIYYVLFFLLILSFTDGWIRVVFGVAPIIISAFIIFACRERIQEIKGGEEDDLGKY